MQIADNAGPDQPAHAQADQGLRCPLTESKDIVEVSTNRECPDQTAWIRTLIWAFAGRIWRKEIFLSCVRVSNIN